MSPLERLAELYENIHACRQCPHVVPSLCPRKVLPQVHHARLALMAQAPSEGGVRKSGVHWVGADGNVRSPGGTFLERYLRTIGYSVDPADTQRPRPYTTNVLHCWTGRRGKRDRAPSRDELGRCKHWWIAELQIIRPTVLLLLGSPAAEAFAQVCDIDARFADMLQQQGVTMTFGDMAIRRFVLPHPVACRRGRSDSYREVFHQIGHVLGGLKGGARLRWPEWVSAA